MNSSQSVKQFIISEFQKCKTTPTYFFSKYVKVRHPKKGIVLFNLYDYQKNVLESLLDPNVKIVFIVKSRQIGVTQLIAEYILYLTRFFPVKEALIVSQKLDKAVEVQNRINFSIRRLPKWMKPKLKKDALTRYRFRNESSCMSVPTSDDAARSKSLNLLFIDEADTIKNVEEVWSAAQPTLSTGGGKVIVVSTLKRYGWFWNSYKKFKTLEEAGDKTIRTFFLPYQVHPEYGEDWYNDQVKAMGEIAAQRELKCDLSESEYMFYNERDIAEAYEERKPLVTKREIKTKDVYGHEHQVMFKNPDIWIWEKPKENGFYFITCDTAKGDAHSKNAIEIWNLMDFKQVAEYCGDVDVNELVWLLKWFAELYNWALVAVEENYTGYQVVSRLKEQGGYINVIVRVDPKEINMDSDENEIYMVLADLRNRYRNAKYKIGWNTNTRTRPLMLDKSRSLLPEVKIYSSRLVNELREFEVRGNRPKGRLSDDLVISYAMFVYLAEYFCNLKTRESRKSDNLKDDLKLVIDLNKPKVDNKEEDFNKFIKAIVG